MRAAIMHFQGSSPKGFGIIFLMILSILASSTVVKPTHADATLPSAVADPPSVTPFQPEIPWGGRTVAVDVSPANAAVAIAASDSGGLFQTTDSGATWSHIDSLQPFRM